MPETIKKKISQEKLESLQPYNGRELVAMLGVQVFSEYLEETGIEKSTQFNLHTIPEVLKKFDIADIRVENDISLDIRVILGDKYPQMCIPKEHFSKGIQANIYIGMRIDPDLEEAEIIGFIKTKDITGLKGNNNYFVVDFDELTPISELEESIKSINKQEETFLALDHEKAKSLFIPFIDGNISEIDQDFLLEHIAECADCREKINNLYNLDKAIKIQKQELLLDSDYTLRVLSGDPALSSDKEVEIEIPEEEKKSPARDWADELANGNGNGNGHDSTSEEKEEEVPLALEMEEEFSLKETEESLDNSKLLEEEEVLLHEEESPEVIEEAEETVDFVEQEAEQEQKSGETGIENILESLEDVETIQKEEDINDILTFLEQEEAATEEKAKVEPPPLPPEPEPELPPPPQIDKGQAKVRKGDNLGYTSILDVDKPVDTDIDFIVEEDLAPLESIRQEDLKHIFEEEEMATVYRNHQNNNGKTNDDQDLKSKLLSLVTDRNLIAITAAVTLSTTVLFLYLGQVKTQVKVSNKAKTDILKITIPEPPVVTVQSGQNKNDNIINAKEKRVPLKTYSREIVRVIKVKKAQEQEIKPIKKVVVPSPQLEVKRIPINEVSWELDADLVKDQRVREYFLAIGQTIKGNLSKDLYATKLDIKNSEVGLYVELNKNGDVIKKKIFASSGYKKVDNICLNTMVKTISQSELPKIGSKQDKIKLELMIRI